MNNPARPTLMRNWIFAVFLLSVVLQPQLLLSQDQTQDLAGTDSVAADEADSKHYLREFEISGLRTRLANECSLVGHKASDWVRHHVFALLDYDQNSPQRTITAQGKTDASQSISVNEDSQGVMISGDRLLVYGTQNEVQLVGKSLERIVETGVAQVVMRLSVFQGSAEDIEKLRIRWAHVETSTSIAANAGDAGVVAAGYSASDQAGGVTLAGMMLNKDKPRSMEAVISARLSEKLQPPASTKDSTWIEASSVVELGTPVLYTMLAPDELARMYDSLKEQSTIKTVSSTMVAAFNGNPTQINNVIERPYVTSVESKRLMDNGESHLVFQPKTKVYPEGFRFIVRPMLMAQNRIRLTCSAQQFGIQKVRTLDIPVAGEVERTIRVQMPTASKSCVRAQMDIPKDFALALSTESLDADGQPLTTLFVCQCSTKELDESNGK